VARRQISYHVVVSYQVLARSWRPQQFGDLLGQDAVVQTLQNALKSDALGHAYLFSGLRGVGKTTAARLLAKAVNCADGPTPKPCDDCESCREIAAGSSIDVVEIDGASNRKIEDVRELREMLRFHPTRDRFRVIIIDEVHMLTREAFNALLKSLEEPPPYILFILATTERHRVPATILSRCQQLEFRPLSNESIRTHLENIAGREGFSLSSGAAESIAAAAQGSVRDALSLVDQLRAFAADEIDDDAVSAVLGVPSFEVTTSLVTALVQGRITDVLSTLRSEFAVGHDAALLFHEVGRALRLMLHLSVDPELEPSLSPGQRAALEPVATELGTTTLTRMLGLWLDHEPGLRDAGNRELALEVAALRLARWPSVRQLEQWLVDGAVPSSATGASSPPSASTGGGGTAASGATTTALGELLRADHPRLAGAVEAASVSCESGEVTLAFETEASPLGRLVGGNDVREVLLAACRQAYPGCTSVRVAVAGGDVADADPADDLRDLALNDPGVQLARSVIGGDIVAIRSDGGG
jgi:DNA polymerase-3 subunit gamma/tau